MTAAQIDANAKLIWDYMQLHEKPKRSEAVFCLCSHDTRVAVRAAELMRDGYGKILVISGGLGKLTKDIFSEPEAEVFKRVVIENGVAEDKIILETESTNTGENVRFTYKRLHQLGIQLKSFVLVQKPYMERRTFATFKKQWPDSTTQITVTSPCLTYDEYTAAGIPEDQVINIMVGDLQRIKEYPRLGYQIEQSIPAEVWQAFQALVADGFNKHLME